MLLLMIKSCLLKPKVSAGLGAPSSLMKADSIVAISFLLEKFGKSIDSAFIKEVNSLILLLLKE